MEPQYVCRKDRNPVTAPTTSYSSSSRTSFNWRLWPSQRHPSTLLYPGHRLTNFFIFIWPRSCTMLSSHLYLGLSVVLVVEGFHLNIILVALASGILCIWPNQLSLWVNRLNCQDYWSTGTCFLKIQERKKYCYTKHFLLFSRDEFFLAPLSSIWRKNKFFSREEIMNKLWENIVRNTSEHLLFNLLSLNFMQIPLGELKEVVRTVSTDLPLNWLCF